MLCDYLFKTWPQLHCVPLFSTSRLAHFAHFASCSNKLGSYATKQATAIRFPLKAIGEYECIGPIWRASPSTILEKHDRLSTNICTMSLECFTNAHNRSSTSEKMAKARAGR